MFPNKRVEEFYTLYQQLLNFSDLSWWLIDLEDDPDIFYCNDVMSQTFSLDPDRIQHSVNETCPIAGDYNKYIAIKDDAAAKQIFDEYKALREGKVEEYSNTFPYYNPDSQETLYYSSRAKILLKDTEEKAALLFGLIEPKIVSKELLKIAKTDFLTDLNNRREFDTQLKFLFNLALREKHPLSLIMCDIDNFKAYNDSLGHYAGDECLRQVAKAIKNSCSRLSDIPCRYGGEEFAVIVYADKEEALQLGQNIVTNIQTLALPHPVSNTPVVTISVGVATLNITSNSTIQELIENADKALYQAKGKKKNICVQY
ncbi:diguanylate cyclase [Sulfurimonas paralvinellae]|uniref:diguanylate cyclase n=1 Tax=Sulfurimonas paralvinellae TaxID=317658 RepID=A0A7M1B5N2_9BACT|nr:diguanylate cyclase [Sulfurimonas paralvinellae]QOP44970.1 GGDEF domain-containing protein [Sulfurimonas paralvinellae]